MDSKALSFQMNLTLTAIIFISFVCSAKEFVAIKTVEGNLTIADLCVNGKTDTCAKMTFDQATSVCGKTLGFWTLKYTNFTVPKCNGPNCHTELNVTLPDIHAALDCQQNGTAAKCTCVLYQEKVPL
uniref:Uncharacterized protein n=1 Tax=Cacopsylla melanoneura TaxID=428564 RepID=A0A8D8PPL7_9HEMI